MDLRVLKKVRVIISIIFFLSILALFFDLSFSIQSSFSEYPLFLQFIPSFLNFVSAASLAGIGFILVIIFTLLFGRVYCSSVCPLGILQDVITYIKSKFRKQYFSYLEPHSKIRYSILAIVIIMFLFGTSFSLNITDPYSNFGRIVLNIFRPMLVWTNNLVSSFFELFGSFLVSPFEYKGINVFSLIFSFSIFILIIWFSYNYGRLYCNTICPVGTLLGLLSKYSFFKINVIESNCIECGDCETVCKSNCIESQSKQVDFSRCVGCFNCFDICPSIGISYQPRYSFNKSTNNNNRRSFIINFAIFLFGSEYVLKAQEKIEVYVRNKIPVVRNVPVSPPGSVSNNNFNDNCTACHLCVASCPTQVLQPSFLEYGLLEIMQPRMDYKTGYCNYDCTICTDVCPSGAIISTSEESKKTIQLGKAKFLKDNCVVYTQKTDCGACAEHCPTKAVKMVDDLEVKKKAPVITDDICVGCGACEYACPTIPYKAIYVEGNRIHQIAQKPKEEKLDEVIDHKEAFPF